jgi:hypothetical protein
VDNANQNLIDRLRAPLLATGFVFVPQSTMWAILQAFGSLDDWQAFEESWNDLAFDAYLADHGRYRRRRHAVFTARGAPDARMIERAPHQPHYQSLDYNPLQGGIERWFEPITVGDGPSLRTILTFCHALFSTAKPDVTNWRVETHQFRIEARDGEPGQPTPEGVHRDGVDFVLVLMIRRTNIAQGTTTIHARDGTLLGSFTLSAPFDAALVDDVRVYHGVTAVEPVDPTLPAHRDVLVVTFKQVDH